MSTTTDRTSCLEILSLVADGENLIELRFPIRGTWGREWARTPEDAAAKARRLQAEGREVYVGMLPRLGTHAPDKTTYLPSRVLWIDADSERSVLKLADFDPQPTAIVLSGGVDGRTAKVHAYWGLTEPLRVEHVKRSVQRLQHHLDADPASTDCGRILRLPGSVHKSGRVAELVSFTGELHSLRSIVGDLPDSPEYAPADTPRVAKPSSEWVAFIQARYAHETTGRHEPFRSLCGHLLAKGGGIAPGVLMELAVCWAMVHIDDCPPRAELERNFLGIVEQEATKRKQARR